MNKTQTKIDAERYEAPQMKEHVIACSRRLMQNTSVGGSSIDGMTEEEVSW